MPWSASTLLSSFESLAPDSPLISGMACLSTSVKSNRSSPSISKLPRSGNLRAGRERPVCDERRNLGAVSRCKKHHFRHESHNLSRLEVCHDCNQLVLQLFRLVLCAHACDALASYSQRRQRLRLHRHP